VKPVNNTHRFAASVQRLWYLELDSPPGQGTTMTIQLLLAYGLGAVAALAAVLILVSVKAVAFRRGAAGKALAAAALTLPSLLLLLGRPAPDTGEVAALMAPPAAAEAAVDANGMKQDADWSLISHMYLGGPPPGSAATAAEPGAATARAQRSAAELAVVTKREPGNVEAWLAMAQAHRLAREYPPAIAAYEAALKLDARNADAWADYADALASASNRRLDGAPAVAIARALKLEPAHLKGLWLQASLDLERRHYQDALARWKKLRAALPPGSPDISVIDSNIAEAEQLASQPAGRP
jgi:cytochrome c-type biogenesis protein CcmH/NrfG